MDHIRPCTERESFQNIIISHSEFSIAHLHYFDVKTLERMAYDILNHHRIEASKNKQEAEKRWKDLTEVMKELYND